jgi:prophage regulatory protein
MIYLLIERGEFPRQVPVAARAVAWVEVELDAWIETRISRRSRNPGQTALSQAG